MTIVLTLPYSNYNLCKLRKLWMYFGNQDVRGCWESMCTQHREKDFCIRGTVFFFHCDKLPSNTTIITHELESWLLITQYNKNLTISRPGKFYSWIEYVHERKGAQSLGVNHLAYFEFNLYIQIRMECAKAAREWQGSASIMASTKCNAVHSQVGAVHLFSTKVFHHWRKCGWRRWRLPISEHRSDLKEKIPILRN